MGIPDLRDVPVLVTGGAGFIGSHLVDALAERGARVRVLDDLSAGKLDNLARWLPAKGSPAGPVAFLRGDVRDLALCREACEGVRWVFHQAASISVPGSMAAPAETLSINVQGTVNVLTAARDAGVRRVVYASSSGVYGDSMELPLREGREGRVLSPYSLSKAVGEQVAETFGRIYGLETVGLRYFNAYGPRQDPSGAYAGVIPLFFKACLKGETPVIFGDGEQTRDFTYIEDAVTANLLAAGAPEAACGRAYNVASTERVTINELAQIIGRVTGRAVSPERREARAGDVRHSHADVSAASAALGFAPGWKLADGLAQCLEYYKGVFAQGE
ncbi:MAG: SDR family oxidoreductase [Acidobacteriota bacterium]